MTRFRHPLRLWQRLDVTLRDLPLGLLLLTASLLPALHNYGTQLGGVPDRPLDALGLVAAALQCLPLAGRRRWPALTLALVACGFALDQLAGYHLVAGTALPLALISTGARLHRYRRTVLLAGSAAFVVLAVALTRVGAGEPLTEWVMFYAALALFWGIGTWLRSTRAAEAERRRRVAEDTRAAERARIARELHDVVTHHVTAMVVQTEAARYLTAAPERLDETLSAVTDTGRRAIGDLRRLLDVIDPDHLGPAADEGLLPLVERIRRAGQPVEFTEEGAPAAPPGDAGLVAHRVVQEALTNALRYAHGSRTTVRVRHRPEGITVQVGTDRSRTGAAAPAAAGGGRGLAGLRERVEVLGGDFTAGPRPDGGFTVRARIPAAAPAPAPAGGRG